jgi:transposase
VVGGDIVLGRDRAIRFWSRIRSVRIFDGVAAGARKWQSLLTPEEFDIARARLVELGYAPAVDGTAWTDEAIAAAVEVSQPTVHRVRRQYVEEGLAAALNRRPPTRVYQRKLDGVQEAHLVALACSTPPTGQARWTLRLLAAKLVELEVVDDVSYQTVRRVLKKTNSSPG